ncbi:MAG: hypothetical protein ACREFQ_04455 [Stellaceae bacterium]
MRAVCLLVLLALAACAPAGPPYATVAGNLPPIPAGTARIFFYRWLEPYETLAPTQAYLNGREVGVTEPGAVFYRDVPPGEYTVAVRSDEPYPNQFKTVVLKPRDIAYARIESLKSWSSCGGGGGGDDGGGGSVTGCRDTFVVVMVSPRVAQYEMSNLTFIRG